MSMVLYNLLYATLQAELLPDNIQTTVLSLLFLHLAVCLVLMTIIQKINCNSIAKLLHDCEELFNELPYRDELERKLKLRIVLSILTPVVALIHNFIIFTESLYSKESMFVYGNKRFDRLCAEYPIQEIYNIWGCLSRNVVGQFMCVLFVPVSMLIDNVFLKLCAVKMEDLSSNSVDAVKIFIRIHRKASKLLKLLDGFFRQLNLLFTSIMLVNLIFRARVILTKQSKISYDHIFAFTFYFMMFMVMIPDLSKLQSKCRKSLCNLMELASNSEKDKTISPQITNVLQLKIDLYILQWNWIIHQ
ncbi:hypothetical protein CHUAL_011220 [Chamberlinius hualienensis]